MSSKKPIKVAIIGGGIAGLSTAFLVAEKFKAVNRTLQLKVFEKEKVTGGYARSERIGGFLCELGPNGFLDNEPTTLQLVKMLNLENRLQKSEDAARYRFIVKTGELQEVPLNPPQFLKSKLISFPGKLRMAMEYFIPSKKDDIDESIDSFGRRRLGNEFADILLDPMVSGVFAGDSKKLSLESTFPKMVQMEKEYGGLFKALISKKKEMKKIPNTKTGGPTGPGGILYTFKDGMGELTSTLTEILGSSIVTNEGVEKIKRTDDNRYEVQTAFSSDLYDFVVLATPSYETAKMVKPLNTEVSDILSSISFAPVVVVCHGYEYADDPLDLRGFGFLIPRLENYKILGTLWSSSIFKGQAPDGKFLLRTIGGGDTNRDFIAFPEKRIEDIVKEETSQIMNLSTSPIFTKIYRHTRGIAQYYVGHKEKLKELERFEREYPGIYFTGSSYRGVSVNMCIKDAFHVSDKISDCI